jgi:SAM-dependent methyltransferase
VVVPEDLHICYPPDYYTHSAESVSVKDITDRLASESMNGRLRRAVVDAVRKSPTRGWVGMLGSLMARSRRLRERAHFGLVLDELIPWSDGELRALEIGPGGGELLRTLKAVGWRAEGVEWDEAAARVATTNSGCSVAVGDFLTLPLPKQAFDLIVLHHVFEHLHDPRAALLRMKELLTPSGRIALIFPNPTSLGALVYGANWINWDPPRHLFFTPKRALGNLAAELRLSMQSRSTGRLADFYSAASRRFRRGETVTPDTYQERRLIDSLLKAIETTCIVAGVAVGDELVAVLRPVNGR